MDPALVDAIPYVQECVFLHADNVRCLLPLATGPTCSARTGRSGRPGLPSILSRLLERPDGRRRRTATDTQVVAVVDKAGFAVRREREVGSWRLVGQLPSGAAGASSRSASTRSPTGSSTRACSARGTSSRATSASGWSFPTTRAPGGWTSGSPTPPMGWPCAPRSTCCASWPKRSTTSSASGHHRLRLLPGCDAAALAGTPVGRIAAARPEPPEQAVNGLKFAEILPPPLAVSTLADRLADPQGAVAAYAEPRRDVLSREEGTG